MKKNDLIAAMVENGMSKQEAVHALVVLAKIAEEQITAGNAFALPGIATIQITERAARTGRNPATGEAIQIEAKRVLKIKPVKALKDLV